MAGLTKAEQFLLDQIRRGDPEGWSQLLERYQGRLVAFAHSKLGQRADAEDIVQDTLVGFLKGLNNFRGQASLETYLFTILRRNIISNFRSKTAHKVCLLQDICASEEDSSGSDVLGQVPGSEPTASWYARKDEQEQILREALTTAVVDLVDDYKRSLKFRELKLIDLLFYGQLTNKKIAKILGLTENQVAVSKHRYLAQLRDRLGPHSGPVDISEVEVESLLSEVWEDQRPSCLKRNTVGAFLLGTLEDAWRDYADFHLHQLGCQFCRANLEDLQQSNEQPDASGFRRRVMESTVGFFQPGGKHTR